MPRPKFPQSLVEFLDRFGPDEACYEFLRDSRYPDGFKCRGCEGTKAYDRADRWGVRCARCGLITSVTAGTVMDHSKIPLKSWMVAAWLLVTSKRGVSALEIQGQLGLKSYKSAFGLLHKLRRAMVAPDRTRLAGAVEVDEAYFGAHGDPDKVTVVGAVEASDKGPARCRFRVIPEATGETLKAFIRDTIEPGATVVTDGATMYKGLPGYRHEVQVVGKGYEPGEVLPYFHTAVGNLRAWLAGTLHGAVRPQHLQAYLDEFAFRYNRRGNLQAAFQTLLGLVPKVGIHRYATITGGAPGRAVPHG
jgi:hypothetical protein